MRALIVAGLTFLAPAWAEACQQSYIIHETDKRIVRVEQYNGGPISNARLLIRETTRGMQTIWNKPKGPVVARKRADRNGRISLPRLSLGLYWFTYEDKQDGESFLVQVTGELQNGEFSLSVNSYVSQNLCHTIDIERNVTKPVGWTVPVTDLTQQEEAAIETVTRLCGKLERTERSAHKSNRENEIERTVAVPKAEVFLFDRTDSNDCCDGSRLVAKDVTSRRGDFGFPERQPGNYWLMTKVGGRQYSIPLRFERSREPNDHCSNFKYGLWEKNSLLLSRVVIVE